MSWTVENHIVRAHHRSHKMENLGVVFNRCIRYSFHQSPDGGSSGLGQPDVAGSISLDRLTAQRPMGKKKERLNGLGRDALSESETQSRFRRPT
jgi:hypothetical protein